jgi:hypothetical protein
MRPTEAVEAGEIAGGGAWVKFVREREREKKKRKERGGCSLRKIKTLTERGSPFEEGRERDKL